MTDTQSVDVNGTKLHYVELGRKTKPVVFAHEALADYRVWQSQLEPFSRKYRVIAYSRRHCFPNELQEGFHYSPDNDAVTQFASDLVELVRKLRLGSSHIIGH